MSIKEIVKAMTLEEKASLLSGKTQFSSQDIKRLNIPEIHFADGPHGVRKQLGAADHLGLNESAAATCFPPAATIANSWDETLIEKMGQALGVEAINRDVQVLLGPGLNIKRHPRCGRNFEYFSEDPYVSGKLAAALIRGIQSTGTVACPKHYVANSQETKRMVSDSYVDERTLREIYATGFEIAVKEGKAKSIMTSYNKLEGVYTNEVKSLLLDLLVDEWQFDGFVVSDWGGSNDHVQGVIAGSHLEMPGTGINAPKELVQAVENGQLEESILDERVETLLTTFLDIEQQEEGLEEQSHHELASRVAANSMVLLKNDDAVLPLADNAKVTVIGDYAFTPRYQGAGSSAITPTKLDSLVDVIQSSALNVIGCARGFKRDGKPSDNLKQEALALAQKGDYVIYSMGLSEIIESEGMDRVSIALPQNQLELLQELQKLDVKIIVLLASGSVVEIPFAADVQAILHTYLAGQAGAKAIVDIICGNVNPSGKLTETYPIKASDIVIDNIYPSTGDFAFYYEGIYVGYRYYDINDIKVQYPFGYGLSYTTFAYSDFQVNQEGITFKLTNTGKMAGSEVVQLYVAKNDSTIARPRKELKGFKKVYLEVNETKEISIKFDTYTFRCYNPQTKRFEIEGGDYDIMIAQNSLAIVAKSQLNIMAENFDILNNQQYYPGYKSGKISLQDDDFQLLYDKKLPQPKDRQNSELGYDDTLSDLKYAKNPLARMYGYFLQKTLNRSIKKGKPNLNLLFQSGMPFRALTKMTNGMIDVAMVQAILVICNGHFFKGVKKLWIAYGDNQRLRKKRGH